MWPRTRPHDLARAMDYWQQRNARFFGAVFPGTPPKSRPERHGLTWKWASRDGHAIPDFAGVLSQGLGGLRAEARRAAAAPTRCAADAANARSSGRRWIAALEALSAYIRRYAALAGQYGPARGASLAAGRGTGDGRNAVSGWPSTPRAAFAEALQLVWFVHLGIKLDDGGMGTPLGVSTSICAPFYRADLAAGRLDEQGARELLALFWIKLNREGDDIAHLSLGGQTPQGEDAANELSVLCLQVERWMQPQTAQPVDAGASAHHRRLTGTKSRPR